MKLGLTIFDVVIIGASAYFFTPAATLWTLVACLTVNNFIASRSKASPEGVQESLKDLTNYIELTMTKTIVTMSVKTIGKIADEELYEHVLTLDGSVYEYSGFSNKNTNGTWNYTPDQDSELLLENGLIYKITNKKPEDIEFVKFNETE